MSFNVKSVLEQVKRDSDKVQCFVGTSRLFTDKLGEVIRKVKLYSKYDALIKCTYDDKKMGVKLFYDKRTNVGKVIFAVLTPVNQPGRKGVQKSIGFAVMPVPEGVKIVFAQDEKIIIDTYEALARTVKREFIIRNDDASTNDRLLKAIGFYEKFVDYFFNIILTTKDEQLKLKFFIKASEFIINFVEDSFRMKKSVKKQTTTSQKQSVKSEPQQEQKQVQAQSQEHGKEQSTKLQTLATQEAPLKKVLKKKREGDGAGVVEV